MLTPGLAHHHAEAADEARLVGIADEQHVRRQLELHADVAHLDDARPPVGEHRAGDRAVVLVGAHREPDVALERAVLAARRLLERMPRSLRADGGRDHVDVRQQRPQHAGQRRGRQRLGVELATSPEYSSADALDAGLGELARERCRAARRA